MIESIFAYYQQTARKRGWPPTPIEVAKAFDLSTASAVDKCLEVRQRLDDLTASVELPRQIAAGRMSLPPLAPPVKSRPANLEKFTGRDGWPAPHDRAIYYFYSYINPYHRGTVDYMFHDEMIAVTPETEGYLYSAEASRLPDYRPGSRPFLEKVAKETTRDCMTDRAKALALVNLIANPKASPYRGTNMIWDRFLGGTEEEVIKKSWHMCNEISRALSFLCQVAGLPARPIFIFTDPVYFTHGHSQTEIFFDGKWNLVEQNHGLLYLKSDGYFASTVELRDNPDIVNSRADAGGMLASCSRCFTSPTAIIQYRIDDVVRYNYQWQDKKYLEYKYSGFDYSKAYGQDQPVKE